MTRLEKVNSKILITYNTGAITIRTDGKKMEVDEYLGRESSGEVKGRAANKSNQRNTTARDSTRVNVTDY